MKKQFVINYLNEVKMICDSISIENILEFSIQIENIKNKNGRIFFLGVGGSAGNASHAVNDFRKILGIESYAVTDNVSELTARINDEGWDVSYVNFLKASRLSKNDAIMIFSVGGGSSTTSINLVKAMEYAKETGTTVLSIVSRDGGAAKSMSDVCVLVPVIDQSRITPHAEEWQAILWHLLVSMIKESKS
jgi:D-sedoheptulose 7-phosphate isomerase